MYEFLKREGPPIPNAPDFKVGIELEDGEEIVLNSTNTIVYLFDDPQFDHCRYSDTENEIRGVHLSSDLLERMQGNGFATVFKLEPDSYTREINEIRLRDALQDFDKSASELLDS